MTRINLLPWREERFKNRQQNFANTFLLSILTGIMLIVLIHTYLKATQDYQANRNQIISKEIALIDQKIIDINGIEEKTNYLLAKINVIQQLQASRPEIVHLVNEIPKLIPEGVYLTKFSQTGTDLLFEGKSQSNSMISTFMRAIQASTWLQTPKLKIIQSQDTTTPKINDSEQMSDFILSATQTSQAIQLPNKSTNEAIRR